MTLRGFTLCVSLLLSLFGWKAFCIDREAFTFTKYDLDIRIDPAQHRLGSRGTITLRNDSATTQKLAILQISSSLNWRSIKAGGKPLQFLTQLYNSDIDHTGMLSEALVTLPQSVAPNGTLELEVAYEGVVTLDATRLTRMDTPLGAAQSEDWDQISAKFTAVRGAGYVAWYPVATDAASLVLSQGTDLFNVWGRWNNREQLSAMHVQFTVTSEEETPELLVNATACPVSHEAEHEFFAECSYRSLGSLTPTFIIADYEVVERSGVKVHFLRGHNAAAANYGDAAAKVLPLISDWFGAARRKAETADLADDKAAPFESEALLLMPLAGSDPKLAGLVAAHQLTHAAFFSPRAWINEGLAHFAQALYVENQQGRGAALDYMRLHRSPFGDNGNAEKRSVVVENTPKHSLVKSTDEDLSRGKAMYVWWMLRDMIGEAALKKVTASYRAEEDKEPSYVARLIQEQTQRDLEWFFDDWVYRDRGLPDFKVKAAFTRKTLPEGYLLTVTVENSGPAGAEVPLSVKFAGGEVTRRLVVRGESSGVIRVEVPKPPQAIVVNDGSVLENRVTDNVFKIDNSEAGK